MEMVLLKKNIIFGVISFILILIICVLSNKITSKVSTATLGSSDEAILSRAKSELEKISDEEKKDFTNLDVDAYLNMLNNEETFFLLIGRSGCEYCQIGEPILQNIMYNYNLDIYYISTDDFTKDGYEKLTNSNELFSSFSTPLLISISSGVLVDYQEGLTDTEGYLKFLNLNNEEK